jgi:uncharacterized protein YigE (DUF2233 family)
MKARRNAFVLLGLLLSFFGAGCFHTPLPASSIPNPSVSSPLGGAWTMVADGFDRLDYRFATSSSAKLVIYRLDPQRFEVRVGAGDAKTVAAWADAYPDAVLAINAAYFHEDDSPSGFLAVEGKRVGERAFDLDKSGLVVTQPAFQVIDTLAEAADLSSVKEGLQSYPFLLKNGEPAVAADSGKTARRTFVGKDRAGRIYLGLALGDLSLYELAVLLPNLGINWDSVLNLDGGPSSGAVSSLVAPSRVQENSLSSIPSVFLVFPRKNVSETP